MRTSIAALVAVAVGCSSPSPSTGDDDPVDAAGMEPQADAGEVDPPADAPAMIVHDPAQPGPWLAGVRTVTLTDPARNRMLSVDVWYPVDPANPDGEDNTYSLLGGLIALDSPARRDATPAAGGPWPVVMFSHGYGGVRFQSFFLTEQLASHGFVVVSPDHPGNTLLDFAQLGDDEATAQSAIDRPLDVILAAERAIAGTLGVAVTVDPERIAVSGHSFGGWTALEVARRDERFRVVIPLAPGFRAGATPDFVADLARPIAVFGGTFDETCPFESDQHLPYDLAQPPKALIGITAAGHLDFSDLCAVPIATAFVDDGCDPANIEPAAVHARVKTIATAFLHRYLDGETGYEMYLEPAWVGALGLLTYWRAP
jgi:predicted dienelactone hydrolase